MQPIYDFGGGGEVMYIALANGFPPQTYIPLLQPFTESYRVICLTPRALWPEEKPPDTAMRWNETLAADLINGLREHDLRNVIAIGHSMGGVASIIAAEAEPDRFKALILLDPTILPKDFDPHQSEQHRREIIDYMVNRANSRRDHFESYDAAYAYFKDKPLFADWPEENFRQYVQSCVPANGGVTLAWPREWEAFYFGSFYAGTWKHLPGLRNKLPILAIRGGNSDTFWQSTAEQMQAILPEMDYAEIDGHGHLFPQSAPDAARRAIQEWLFATN